MFAAMEALVVLAAAGVYLSLVVNHVDREWEKVFFGLLAVVVYWSIFLAGPGIIKPVSTRLALWVGVVGMFVAVTICLIWIQMGDSAWNIMFVIYGVVLMFTAAFLKHWGRSGGRIRLEFYEKPQEEPTDLA